MPVPLEDGTIYFAEFAGRVGLISRPRVLTPEYIEACKAAGKLLPEDDYELRSIPSMDKDTRALHDAARMWRLRIAANPHERRKSSDSSSKPKPTCSFSRMDRDAVCGQAKKGRFHPPVT